ncbi:MAG: hypothetical protein ABIJ74_02020 [archaeon]
MNEKIPLKKKKDENRFPFKKKKKKIRIPFNDLTALPSENEFGNEFH